MLRILRHRNKLYKNTNDVKCGYFITVVKNDVLLNCEEIYIIQIIWIFMEFITKGREMMQVNVIKEFCSIINSLHCLESNKDLMCS